MSVITITAWRRPSYFLQMLNSLSKCDNSENTIIFVSIDGGYPIEQEKMVEIGRKFSDKLNINFKIFENNIGCAANTWYSLRSGFNLNVDFVIHLEDDVIVSNDFLIFIKKMDEKYKDNKEIFNVSSYSRDCNDKDLTFCKLNLNTTNLRSKFTSSGPWGIWRDRWNEIKDNWFGIHWNSQGLALAQQDKVPEGEEFLKLVNKDFHGSWAWPMNKYWRKGRKEVYPIVSRCQNIGIERGAFNPNAEFHYEHHHIKNWIEEIK